jgi:predicted nucleic acid-binding protein
MQLVRAREHAADVRDLLSALPADEVFVTDFAVYSIALAMRRHQMLDQLSTFIRESRIGEDVRIVRLAPSELTHVVHAAKTFQLDFDDALQYAAAELYDLRLVSLDADFDRTPRRRLTPNAALKLYLDEQQLRPEQP